MNTIITLLIGALIPAFIFFLFVILGGKKKHPFGKLTGQDLLFDIGLLRVRERENDLIIDDPKAGSFGIADLMEQFAIKKFAEHGMVLEPRPKEKKEMVSIQKPEDKKIDDQLGEKISNDINKNSYQ